MKPVVLVFFTTALICLALAGLRVTLYQTLATPGGLLASPGAASEPETPPPSLPVDSIAGREGAAPPAGRLEPSAMIWSSLPRGRRDASPR